MTFVAVVLLALGLVAVIVSHVCIGRVEGSGTHHPVAAHPAAAHPAAARTHGNRRTGIVLGAALGATGLFAGFGAFVVGFGVSLVSLGSLAIVLGGIGALIRAMSEQEAVPVRRR